MQKDLDKLHQFIANPIWVAKIDLKKLDKYSPSVDESLWIRLNAKLIKEIGPESWLKMLLKALRGE